MTTRHVQPPDDVPGAGGWSHRTVCVAGLGVSGAPAARALLRLGAHVVAVDARSAPDDLAAAGADVRVSPAAAERLPDGVDLVVTSPGWRPDQPLLAAAAARGVPVWGEVELAWRLAVAGGPVPPWLAVTGTNGKTTTVRMLASILTAAGRRTVATGNVGLPVVEAVLAQPPYDVLAVELSSFQLHWSPSVRPAAAVVLNVADDHLDWHGDLASYAAAKGRIYADGTLAVYNVDEPWSVRLAAASPRRHGFTLAEPAPGQLGVAGGVLLDRAFGPDTPLLRVDEVPLAGPHNVANALAAAALARAQGIPADAVRRGLLGLRPEPHRSTVVATGGGVSYVDDSKATNPHAAAASLAAHDAVVWLAGGLLKGADVTPLVRAHAHRFRGVVLLGRDRRAIEEALARHAPDIPRIDAGPTETERVSGTEVMTRAVAAARRLARPGDTVLLAPAAASMDLFRDYAARGDAFAAAVHAALADPAEGAR